MTAGSAVTASGVAAAAAGQPLISLSHVGVAYVRSRRLWGRERFWALEDVSFDLHHGEVLGVIGRNGAGKSTLLQILADIIRPDRGQVRRQDVRASLLSLQLGFVPHLSGRENVVLGGMMMGYRRQEILRRMDDVIAFAELETFIDQPLRTYSAGMAARLGFSVAFQLEPDVLLVDEIMGVGDAEFRKKSSLAMREKIRRNRTVVLVSHDANLMAQLCTRCVWIEHGVTQLVGPTAQVLAAYADSIRAAAAAHGDASHPAR